MNGKLRDRITVPTDISSADLEAAALASERVRTILAGRVPLRVVQAGGGRLVNVVVADPG